jgi:hypothetical protein
MNSYTTKGVRLAAILTSTLAFGGLFITAPVAHADYGATPAQNSTSSVCSSRFDQNCIIEETNYLNNSNSYGQNYNNYNAINSYQAPTYQYQQPVYNQPVYNQTPVYNQPSYVNQPQQYFNYNPTYYTPTYNYSNPTQYSSSYQYNYQYQYQGNIPVTSYIIPPNQYQPQQYNTTNYSNYPSNYNYSNTCYSSYNCSY